VRLIDVPAALKARTYAAPVDLVLDVTDPLCPWNEGRWHLLAGGGEVSCVATDRSGDLSMSVTELGAVYLGGTAISDLAMAGRITENTPGAVSSASMAFRSSPAPWCPVIF
jgi:predicted acetyltransferase